MPNTRPLRTSPEPQKTPPLDGKRTYIPYGRNSLPTRPFSDSVHLTKTKATTPSKVRNRKIYNSEISLRHPLPKARKTCGWQDRNNLDMICDHPVSNISDVAEDRRSIKTARAESLRRSQPDACRRKKNGAS